MLSYAILGVVYAFAAAVQPGQFQAYVISRAVANGWRRTLPAALSPLLSDLFTVSLMLAILTQVPPLFLLVLRLVGGFFLLYLAWGAFRTFRCTTMETAAPAGPAHRTVLEAAFVNVLNPNPYLAWSLVMGPLLLEARDSSGPGRKEQDSRETSAHLHSTARTPRARSCGSGSRAQAIGGDAGRRGTRHRRSRDERIAMVPASSQLRTRWSHGRT
jgi:hypothetical protein